MILVTGGTGFLGGHLLGALACRDEHVRVVCRTIPDNAALQPRMLSYVRGDVTDRGSMLSAMEGIRQVYHVAGRVDFNPRSDKELIATNVEGARNVFEAASAAGVERVVHVSSVSTIGATSDPARPLDEDDFGKGLGVELPYPQSKLRGERVALEFALRGLPVIIVNPTFFLGPNDKNHSSSRTVLAFIRRQVWTGLRTGGFGLTDVRDVARGIILAMERGQPGRRYILGGNNLLLREYHRLLAQLTGLRAPRISLPAALAMPLAVVGNLGYRLLGITPYVGIGDVRLGRHYWIYDYSRSKGELGLTCRLPEDTLRDTLHWLTQEGLYAPKPA